MNKKHLLLGMFAALALTGCSSDDVAENSDNSLISDGTPRYLTVNIVPNASANTKAEYTDGEDNESTVTSVRFYFFTDDGHAAAVKSDGSNYYDWTPTSESGNTSENITKSLEATIVINTKEGDRIPGKILAVVNPRTNVLPSGNADLATLRNTYSDYAAAANASTPVFVMTNSVYRDANSNRVSTSTITSDNLKKSKEEALDVEKKAPVNVYVERNVAKVSVSYSDALAKNVTNQTIALTDKNDKAFTISNEAGESQQVYLKVLGWDLTATTNYTYASKHINTSWKNELLSSTEPWNSIDYKRSFWASNIHAAGNGTTGEELSGINYSTFNQHIAAANVKEVAATSTLTSSNYKYTNENAAYDYDTGEQRAYPTQAIVLGQLVNAAGDPLFVSEYAGSRHLEADANFTQFRTLIANLLADQYYYKNGSEYVSIDPSDLIVSTCSVDASDGDLNAQNTLGRYKVKVQLSEGGLAKTWYVGTTGTTTISTSDLNTALAAYTGKAWNNGYTYYSFRINHLASSDVGQFGIVRNHYYAATIDGIYGLGTPVYDPNKKIYPEDPVDEDTYIAAQIHVLSWRVVPSTVTLGK